MGTEFSFTGEVWLYQGDSAAWHFLSLPEEVTDAIDAEHGHLAKGFGSQRVEATIGATTWRTSVFPSKEQATFILPVKKAVRQAESLAEGKSAEVHLRIIT